MNKKNPSLLEKYAALPKMITWPIGITLGLLLWTATSLVMGTPERAKEIFLDKYPYGTLKTEMEKQLRNAWSEHSDNIAEFCTRKNSAHEYVNESLAHYEFRHPLGLFSLISASCFDKNLQLRHVEVVRIWLWENANK